MSKNYDNIAKACIVTLIMLIFCSLLLCSCHPTYTFDELKNERETIVEKVISGNLYVEDNGLIKLPEDKTYLSDDGVCCIVSYNDSYAVYFFSERGMLGDSKGYLYKLNSDDYDFLDKALTGFTFRIIDSIDSNWLWVETSD